MKRFYFSLFVMVIVTIPGALTYARPDGIKVFLEYTPDFDRRYCKDQINPQWIQEAFTKLPVFQRYWDQQGFPLTQAVESLVGLPYSRRELSAGLILCKTAVGMTMPLILHYWPFLNGPSNGQPKDPEFFLDFIFHETLHRYVIDRLGWAPKTPLLLKYKNETAPVRIHLHLDAIEKMVYLRLGKDEMLAKIIKNAKVHGPDYVRAWQIIESEGWEPFVNELKNIYYQRKVL
jgi:hypothetical protein